MMKSIITAGPHSRWVTTQSLWHHRELLYFLIVRDLKIRYKQTIIGIGWAIAQPLLSLVVLIFVFGTIAKITTDGVPYPVFVSSGFLLWNFFARSISAAAESITSNQLLIRNVAFPRIILPWVTVVVNIVDFLSAFTILIFLMAYFHINFNLFGLFTLAYSFLMMVLFSAGIGSLLALFNTLYRDIRFLIPYALQLLLFVSPIIYPSSLVAKPYMFMIWFNPLAIFTDFVRLGMFGSGSVTVQMMMVASTISIGMFFLGFEVMRNFEKTFTDTI